MDKEKKVLTSTMESIANSDSFVTESDDVELVWKKVEELDDLPLYDFAKVSKLRKYLR